MTPFQYHVGRAQDLYDRYRVALAKLDAFEQEALGKAHGDPALAIGLHLSDRVNPRPSYKALVSAKDGLAGQLAIELAMVGMYANMKPAGMDTHQDVAAVYPRMRDYRP